MEFKIFSFFSGCGLLDLGFHDAGFPIQMVNEFSPSFMNAYRHSRKQMGVGEPAYGYANYDVNSFLSDRKAELSGYIADARV